MRIFLWLSLLFVVTACKTIYISDEITDKQAFKVYKKVLRSELPGQLKYNTDTSFVVCITSNDQIPGEAIDFFVFDLISKKKTFQSNGDYFNILWKSSNELELIKYKESVELGQRQDIQKFKSGKSVYILDVRDGTLEKTTKNKEIRSR